MLGFGLGVEWSAYTHADVGRDEAKVLAVHASGQRHRCVGRQIGDPQELSPFQELSFSQDASKVTKIPKVAREIPRAGHSAVPNNRRVGNV